MIEYSMRFTSPFDVQKRKLFSRTFLQDVEFCCDYIPTDLDEGFRVRVSDFAMRHFKVSVPENSSLNIMNFYADITQTDFTVDTRSGQIDLHIGKDGYRDYESTLKQLIDTVCDFISNVARSQKVTTISLKKSNVFVFRLRDFNQTTIQDVLKFTFSKDNYEGFITDVFNEGQFVKVSRDTKVDLGNKAELSIIQGCANAEEKHLSVLLDLEVNYNPQLGLSPENVESAAEELNQIMFDAFIHVVSDNIVNIMEGR